MDEGMGGKHIEPVSSMRKNFENTSLKLSAALQQYVQVPRVQAHKSMCKQHDAEAQQAFNQEYEQDQQKDDSANSELQVQAPVADLDEHIEFDVRNEGVQSPVLTDASMASNPGPNIPHQPAVNIDCPQDFKTEFHPRSSCEMLYQKFEEFSITPEMQAPPVDEASWHPF
ncbi:hypothetical protein BDR07DRAFT_1386571 [Suillus spraguei]|nr:hypothetical protein BDR07DRAFT_1386571 [Suillus spraguei]